MKKEKITKNEKKEIEGISLRGRSFEGEIIKKIKDKVTVLFERFLFVRKYERYEKRKTKIHARLPKELKNEINVGDLVEIKECKPLSKTINFVVTKKIRSGNESNLGKTN